MKEQPIQPKQQKQYKKTTLLDHHIQRHITTQMEAFDEQTLARMIQTLLQDQQHKNTIH